MKSSRLNSCKCVGKSSVLVSCVDSSWVNMQCVWCEQQFRATQNAKEFTLPVWIHTGVHLAMRLFSGFWLFHWKTWETIFESDELITLEEFSSEFLFLQARRKRIYFQANINFNRTFSVSKVSHTLSARLPYLERNTSFFVLAYSCFGQRYNKKIVLLSPPDFSTERHWRTDLFFWQSLQLRTILHFLLLRKKIEWGL